MLAAIFDGETWRRLVRDPVAWGAMAIGLLPFAGVLVFGWPLGAVVVLYWLENVVIGALAFLRLVSAGLLGQAMPIKSATGAPPPPVVAAVVRAWPARLAFTAFMGAFFVVHYGMFCFVHGIFVLNLFSAAQGGADASPAMDLGGLIQTALTAHPTMAWFLAAIALWKLILFAVFFIVRGDVAGTSAPDEMMAPYGRIVVLHIGIFAGAFALMAFNQPILGVLALIVLKALFDAFHDWRATRMRAPQTAQP